jgi:hypothetical protein
MFEVSDVEGQNLPMNIRWYTHCSKYVSVKFFKFKSEYMCACVRNVTGRILSQMGPLVSTIFFSPMGQHPVSCQGLLVIEASPSHPDKPHLLGLLWTSDQPLFDERLHDHSHWTHHT